MRLTRWNPTRNRSFESFDQDFGRLLNMVFGENGESSISSVAPPMDFVEEENQYKVAFDLPGLEKDEIEVTFHEGVLKISGEKKSPVEETKEGQFVRRERVHGTIERSIRLPEKVDTSKMEAEFKNGVLELTIPFLPESKRVHLEIKG